MKTKRTGRATTDPIVFGDRLTYSEAAIYLRCSVNGLRKKVMYGTVPHVKPFGHRGRVLFLKADLDSFIQAHRVPAMEASA